MFLSIFSRAWDLFTRQKNLNDASLFQDFLSEMIECSQMGTEHLVHEFPKYKYFDSLVADLKLIVEQLGAPFFSTLKIVEKLFKSELKFERSSTIFYQEGLIQIVVSVATINLFVLASKLLVDIAVPLGFYLIVLLMQSGAIFFFYYFYEKIVARKNNELRIISKFVVSLVALNQTGIPLVVMLEKLKSSEVIASAEKLDSSFSKRLRRVFSFSLEKGMIGSNEVELLIDTFHVFREDQIKKQEKILLGFRFLILAIFVLGSFFLFLFQLIFVQLTTLLG